MEYVWPSSPRFASRMPRPAATWSPSTSGLWATPPGWASSGLLRAEGELSAGELTRRLGQAQPKVSNHLACLRWCDFVTTRREHRVVHYRLADQRVTAILELAQGLLDDNGDHVAACCRIPNA